MEELLISIIFLGMIVVGALVVGIIIEFNQIKKIKGKAKFLYDLKIISSKDYQMLINPSLNPHINPNQGMPASSVAPAVQAAQVSQAVSTSQASPAKPVVQGIKAAPAKPVVQGMKAAQARPDTPVQNVNVPPKKPVFNKNNIALIVGVIFVIMAGLIFATTTWKILPDVVKTMMIVSITVLFFGASVLAGKKFAIEVTSKAFYILGCVFLFVSVLSFGFFGLLGSALTPLGSDNLLLYAISVFVTIIAGALGIKKFANKIYNMFILIGISIIFILFVSWLELPVGIMNIVLSMFALVTILLNLVIGKIKWLVDLKIEIIFNTYSIVNIYFIGFYILCVSDVSLMSGIAALIIALTHIVYSCIKKPVGIEPYTFSMFVIIGLMKMINPETLTNWCYGFIVIMICICVLSYLNFFDKKVQLGLGICSKIIAGIAFLMLLTDATITLDVTIPHIIMLCVICIWLTIESYMKKAKALYVIQNLSLSVLVYAVVIYMNLGYLISLIIALIAIQLIYVVFKLFKLRLKNLPGDIIYSVNMFMIILLIVADLIGTETSANSLIYNVIVIVTVCFMFGIWYMEYKKTIVGEVFYPIILFILVCPTYNIINNCMGYSVSVLYIVFVYLVLWMIIELIRKRNINIAICIIFMLMTLMTYIQHEIYLPYAFVLAVYSFIKISKTEKNKKLIGYMGLTNVYAGIFTLSDFMAKNEYVGFLVTMLCIAITFVACKIYKKIDISNYLRIIAVIVYILLFVAYIVCDVNVYGILFVFISFLFTYAIIVKSKMNWLGIISTLFTLFLPVAFALKYDVSTNVIYMAMMIIILLTLSVERLWCKVIDDGKVEWFGIAQVVWILCIAAFGNSNWRFVYAIILCAYIMQFYFIKNNIVKKIVLSTVGVAIIYTYWAQPFLNWSDKIGTELIVLPIAIYAFVIKYIWNDTKSVNIVRTIINVILLLILVVNAIIMGAILNAIILELLGVCILVISYIRNNKLCVKIAGIMLIGVTLYITKGFWLSIAWWIYLLVAGIGLMGFAAYNEIKKH